MGRGEQSPAADAELAAKLGVIRTALDSHNIAAVRLRGTDSFAWLTCGGSSVVDASAERGVAEILVTATDAFVIADRIDATRLRNEEVPNALTVVEVPWAEAGARDTVVRSTLARGARVASDRPEPGELPLPAEVVAARRQMTPAEVCRFRELGADAARALTTSLSSIRPEMSEMDAAALVSAELIGRDMWPVVVLVGGARRLPLYRHPRPRADERIGDRAMVVVCARRHGLVANLTRFVYFRPPTKLECESNAVVAEIEAAALDASKPGATLGQVYGVIARAYATAGYTGAEADHHQGGLAGYMTREEVATPGSATRLVDGSVVAWNPSLPGAKIEDTAIVTADGIEVLTVDPAWPAVEVAGRLRPDLLILG